MANTLNESNLTLNALEQEDVSAFVQQKFSIQPLLNTIHKLWTGVTMKEQIVIVGKMGKSGISDATCDRPNSGATYALSEKFWEPAAIGDTFVSCVATMNGLFKGYFTKIKTYMEKFDLSGSDLAMLTAVRIEDSLSKSIFRYAWFGDKSVAAAGAAAAGLKVAGDAKFYNVINGLWKQIFTAVGAAKIKKVAIPENSQLTLALQLTLAAGKAKSTMDAMWALASPELQANPDTQFLLSGQMYENYYQSLIASNTLDSQSDIINGISVVKYRGHAVINMNTVWDTDLQADFVDNTVNNAGYLPNRAVLTYAENIPIATLEEGSMAKVESFFYVSDTKRANVTSYGYTLDAKVILESDIVVAY